VRTELNHATVYFGSAQPAITLRPGETYTPEDYAMEVDVYYISPWTTASTDSPNVPALYRLTLGADATADLTPQLIATGIENMQVQYGITAGGTTIFKDAGAVAASEWPNVASVRLWLLARSTGVEPGYTNNKSYDMGDLTGTDAYKVNDSFVRQLYPLVIGVRN
jgi:type IV pilus assembly protein PilW